MNLMNHVFKKYLDKFVNVFIDDMLVYSLEKNIRSTYICFLWRLKENKLYGEFKKCEFWLENVSFLGHMVSRERIIVDPSKIETVSGNNQWM